MVVEVVVEVDEVLDVVVDEVLDVVVEVEVDVEVDVVVDVDVDDVVVEVVVTGGGDGGWQAAASEVRASAVTINGFLIPGMRQRSNGESARGDGSHATVRIPGFRSRQPGRTT